MEKTLDIMGIYNQQVASKKITDDGKNGKAGEVALRYYLQPNSKRNGRVTTNYTSYGDMYFMEKQADGKRKRIRVEIKTSAGELGFLQNCPTIDDIMPDMDLIFYAPYLEDGYPIEEQFFVFTRDEFIEYLKGYKSPRGGLTYRTKKATSGAMMMTIQSFAVNGAPAKGRTNLYNYMVQSAYKQATVKEWLEG